MPARKSVNYLFALVTVNEVDVHIVARVETVILIRIRLRRISTTPQLLHDGNMDVVAGISDRDEAVTMSRDGGLPPTYTMSTPQILVAPPFDSASFFRQGSLEGEICVKGLGADSSLRAEAILVNRAPDMPVLRLYTSGPHTVWNLPFEHDHSASSSTLVSFPSTHRFSIPLHTPSFPHASTSIASCLPGTLDLTSVHKGELRWSLKVELKLDSGTYSEDVKVEGTPEERFEGEEADEVDTVVERGGVKTRLLLSDQAPRLGSLLHLGLEVRAMERKKTGVAGLSSQPDPSATLRGLRRVRVELYRQVRIRAGSSAASSSREAPSTERQHLTLLYASGKSLRFPGINNLPLRLLFTLPTAQTGAIADGSWGETSTSTPYHDVSFFVRATFGFGALGETVPSEPQDWVLQQQIRIRPRTWSEPTMPDLEAGPAAAGSSSATVLSDEDLAKEAYRQKGLDIVGTSGTYRLEEADEPPEFEAGPSHPIQSPGLPSFTESEAIAAVGQTPFSNAPIREASSSRAESLPVGRPDSLGGELATWVEYDGYETFSVAPPSASVSYGASGSMDPPQPEDEHNGVAGGIAARLGLSQQGGGSLGGLDLMERLGLGNGTRVVDMHDDLPPGIDEPSLPALPSFNTSQITAGQYHHRQTERASAAGPGMHDISPPSFAASEAAQAVGGMATSIPRQGSVHHTGPDMRHPREPTSPMARSSSQPLQLPEETEEPHNQAPPGYFGSSGQAGGPPAYS